MRYCNINYLQVICYIILMQYEIAAEKITYISTEHPKIISVNPKYISFANMSSRRYGRNDPFYYVEMHFIALDYFANNVTADFYFYEWLTNQYKRGFVEMHFKWCDMVHNDKFFGTTMKQGKLAQPCPFPPGEYHLYNMTIPVTKIPPHFPFRKGRIYGNLTHAVGNELIASGYIDMEIKEFTTRKMKNEAN